jgi:hypothetical protein
MAAVSEALTARKWVLDIKGALTVGVIIEFLHLWEILSNFELQPEVNDTHFWRLVANVQYSWYPPGSSLLTRYGKPGAPPKSHFFLWLAAQRKRWTTDRLACRGLSDPEQCLMCDQVDKTIDHLLVSFIFACQFWFSLLWQVNLHALSLQPEDAPFPVWWKRTNECCGSSRERPQFTHYFASLDTGSNRIGVYLRVQPLGWLEG